MAEFSYRYNPETGRWEIITRHSDGTVEVLHKVKVSFDTPDAAMNHVALLTGKRRRISPGKWSPKNEGGAQNDGESGSVSKSEIQTSQASA